MFAYDTKKAEIYIYDAIGNPEWGMIGAMQVVEALKKMEGKRVTVRINTPGGDVDEGIPMFNAMQRHPGGVNTVVDGIAASMGSYLMLAGENRTISRNAMVMVHNPMSIALGNSSELRKTADILDKYLERMLPDYSAKTGKTVDQLTKKIYPKGVSLISPDDFPFFQRILQQGCGRDFFSLPDQGQIF